MVQSLGMFEVINASAACGLSCVCLVTDRVSSVPAFRRGRTPEAEAERPWLLPLYQARVNLQC
jgi:hypothetical protein